MQEAPVFHFLCIECQVGIWTQSIRAHLHSYPVSAAAWASAYPGDTSAALYGHQLDTSSGIQKGSGILRLMIYQFELTLYLLKDRLGTVT